MLLFSPSELEQMAMYGGGGGGRGGGRGGRGRGGGGGYGGGRGGGGYGGGGGKSNEQVDRLPEMLTSRLCSSLQAMEVDPVGKLAIPALRIESQNRPSSSHHMYRGLGVESLFPVVPPSCFSVRSPRLHIHL